MKILLNICTLAILALMMSCGGGSSSSSSANTTNTSAPTANVDAPPSIVVTTDYSTSGLKHVKHKHPKDGFVMSEGQMKNGKKEGAWVTYHTGRDTGKIKAINNYYDNNLNGVSMEFSNNGTILKRVDYDAGNIHGIYAEYKYNRAQKYIEYTHGEINGTYNTYYSNGKKQQETMYKNGKKNGRSVFYNEGEQIIMDFVYKNDKKISGGKVTPPPAEEK